MGMHVFYGWARGEDSGAGAGLGSLNGAMGFFPFLVVCPDTVERSSENKTICCLFNIKRLFCLFSVLLKGFLTMLNKCAR